MSTFDHVLALLGATDKTSTLNMCLTQNGYTATSDLRLMTQDDINSLMVTKDAGDVTHLYPAGKHKLAYMSAWLDIPGNNKASLLATRSFDKVISDVKDYKKTSNPAPATLPSTSSSYSTHVDELAINFMKGV